MKTPDSPRRRFWRLMLLVLAVAAVIWSGLRVMQAFKDHDPEPQGRASGSPAKT